MDDSKIQELIEFTVEQAKCEFQRLALTVAANAIELFASQLGTRKTATSAEERRTEDAVLQKAISYAGQFATALRKKVD